MRKLIIVYVALIVAVIILAVFRAGIASILPFGGPKAEAQIGNQKVKIEVAKTPDAMEKGLSKRNSLPKDRGMLFIFKEKGKYEFWMRDMRFPLDIVYISDTTVVDVLENVPHKINDSPNLIKYAPKEAANYVLEVNAGRAKELGIKEGTTITFKGL